MIYDKRLIPPELQERVAKSFLKVQESLRTKSSIKNHANKAFTIP